MAADRAPLLFERHLGFLRPANAVAEAALQEIKGKVRVEIRGGVANERRRGLYWTICALVVPILNDLYGTTLDDSDLHTITRDKLKMYDEIKLPSGDVLKKYWSTSNRAMNEAQRAEFTNRAFELWGRWVGIDVATLTAEANNA